MSRSWLIPIIVVAVAIVALLALGSPDSLLGGAPTPVAYEKSLALTTK